MDETKAGARWLADDLNDMSLGDLLDARDQPQTAATHAALLAELKNRNYRVEGLDEPVIVERAERRPSERRTASIPFASFMLLIFGGFAVLGTLVGVLNREAFATIVAGDEAAVDAGSLGVVIALSIQGSIAVCFIGLFFWTLRSPTPAYWVAALFMGGLQLLRLVGDPIQELPALVIGVAATVVLVRAAMRAGRVERG